MNDSLSSLKSSEPSTERPRKVMPTWVIPAAIALGFALLFLLLFRDRLLPATEVRVAVVLSIPAPKSELDALQNNETSANDSKSWQAAMAFQASGWVEPEPLPIKATALTPGVVESVHVLEGEAVTKGQLLATLIRDDTELALKAATSALATKQAALSAQKQVIAAAVAQRQAQAALLDEAADRLKRIENLPSGALSETELTTIRSASQKAIAAQQAAAAEVMRASAQLEVIKSEIAMAQVAVDTAKLAHERTEIRSPIEGRILSLRAVPGQKKMLNMDEEDSATIASLYQPDKLQVRVDVPLADAAGLQIGQLARIKCNLLPDTTFRGVVTRINGEADISRNTLQAKVSIEKPSELLRPEMLCRVEFLQSHRKPKSGSMKASDTTGSLVTWAPSKALQGNSAWICDPQSKRIERRAIEASSTTREGHTLIRSGLKPGEWVVISPAADLKEGQRVNPQLIKP